MDTSVVILAVFLGLAVLRLVLVALGAALILRPVIDCPACFAPAYALHVRWLRRLAPWMEWRWCARCGWQGPARRLTPEVRRGLDRRLQRVVHEPVEERGQTWQ